ncbi:MAG: ribosomal protein L7/L12 [Candidatus Paceibacterota bacterium]
MNICITGLYDGADKIAAIKAVRAISGAGLKEAKYAVETATESCPLILTEVEDGSAMYSTVACLLSMAKIKSASDIDGALPIGSLTGNDLAFLLSKLSDKMKDSPIAIQGNRLVAIKDGGNCLIATLPTVK